MYSIREIPLQNMQDVWSKLFVCMAGSLMDTCGRAAEGVVRKSVRRMAETMGRELRDRLHREGERANLLSLYARQPWFFRDPRFCLDRIRTTEQVWLMEVRTCPLANVWKSMGQADIGTFFCEEYQHGLLSGFTGDAGQTNLSRRLTCPRDNHCRFSCYYRPANMLSEERSESFSTYEDKAGELSQFYDAETVSRGIGELCVRNYSCLFEEAQAEFGSEGVNGVILGIRKAAPMLIADLADEAKRTFNPCDSYFVAENFPLKLNSDEDALWKQFSWPEARELFQINLLDEIASFVNHF